MSKYQWCPYCGRASIKKDGSGRTFLKNKKELNIVRMLVIDESCPFEDCHKGWCEMEEWDELRKIKPNLPEIPEEGKIYRVKGKCKGYF